MLAALVHASALFHRQKKSAIGLTTKILGTLAGGIHHHAIGVAFVV
jgi:hypothetical protein